MLGDFEQLIYNTHLRVTRSATSKPYKLRKDFTDIDPTVEVYVKRIARLVSKFKNIHLDDFFEAPFKVYGADEYFDLKFFTSPRALKAYTVYMQQESDADPDSDVILQRVLRSLQFLKEYCVQESITIEQYISHTTGNLPTFVNHLKERKLSTYVMIELPNTLQRLRQVEPDVLCFMFGENFFANLNLYKTRYFSSSSCKTLVKAGLKKIEKSVVSTTTSI